MKTAILVLFAFQLTIGFRFGHASQSLSSKGGQEFVVSLETTNVTISNDNVLLCFAFNLTSPSLESEFIVTMQPKPAPGMKEYFFFDTLCEEPGYVGSDGELVPWDCGLGNKHPANPPLPRADICSSKSSFHESIPNHFQYAGQSEEEAGLRLPPGTGIPIGGRDDPKFLVLGLHFPLRRNAMNSATGISKLKLTIRPHDPAIRVAHNLNLFASGLVQPQSRGVVSSSWTSEKNEDLKLITLYVHVHHMAIKYEVKIERPYGQADVILNQEAHELKGVTYLPDTPSVHMRSGDRLVLTCFYFNRMDHVLEVGTMDMCYLISHYVVADEVEF